MKRFFHKVAKPYLVQQPSYEKLVSNFKWDVPEYYNIGVDICDKHVDVHKRGDAPALIYDDGKQVKTLSFGDLQKMSNSFSNALVHKLKMNRNDRVAILLPQSPETLIAHISIYKAGGIALPLFTLFGPDALEYRLKDSGTRVLILGDEESFDKISQIIVQLPNLETIVYVSDQKVPEKLGHCQIVNFWDLVGKGSKVFDPVKTKAEDPCFIIYTSGTTGNPKGCLHAHRVLIGHMPGVEYPHSFFPKEGDLFYTPADWAWIGGLCDVLLPSLLHGVPVLANREKKFDPEKTMALMKKHNVRNTFMPPTALKLIKSSDCKLKVNLRSLGSGGESLGENLLNWGRSTFGITIHEFYGQTEANLLIGNCSDVTPVKSGSMGKAIPGRNIQVVNEAGEIQPNGKVGIIATDVSDPVVFKEYWGKPKQTHEKFSGDGKWLLTGDLGKKDDDGYFYFVGREDDIIKTSGYRVGPSEIEDCIAKHDSVKVVAVAGSPDPIRGELVKAFIILKDEYKNKPQDALVHEIQCFVKERLAAYEYPRKIEFVDSLPMTTTGKIQRKILREKEYKNLKK
jgi:acetyl-CoA synthetase